VKFEKHTPNIYTLLQKIYGETIMSRTKVFFVWVKQFQGRREVIPDDRRSIHPSTCITHLQVQ